MCNTGHREKVWDSKLGHLLVLKESGGFTVRWLRDRVKRNWSGVHEQLPPPQPTGPAPVQTVCFTPDCFFTLWVF